MDPVKLSEVDFWRLKALAENAKRLETEASVTPQALEARQAWARAGQAFEAVAKAQGFDPTLTMTFDESTCSLVPVPQQTPPQ